MKLYKAQITLDQLQEQHGELSITEQMYILEMLVDGESIETCEKYIN